MSLRDGLVPLTDLGNKLSQQFGLSRFQVILRRRTWSGDEVGRGQPTNDDIVMDPSPEVSFQPPFARQMEYILAAGGSIRDRYYKVESIAPAYTKADGTQGGYTPQQLRMRVPQGVKNVEPLVVLVGDDGMARVCTQVVLEDGDPFSYSMTLQEKDKDSVAIDSLAITPSPATLAAGVTKLPLTANGTYADGSVFDVTSLVRWTSSDPTIATVDLLGVVKRVSAGTVQVQANMGRVLSPLVDVTVQ